MIKKIAAVSIMMLTLTGCVSPSEANPIIVANTAVNTTTNNINLIPNNNMDFMTKISLMDNRQRIVDVVNKLKKTVGRTWYVFSGDTPAGWDCSGLTMWTYQQLGITLEHRASVQQHAGHQTKTPVIGDIVVFTYKGSSVAYHVGIYLGNGMMIDAPSKGLRTQIQSINDFGGSWSKVTYRRLINSL